MDDDFIIWLEGQHYIGRTVSNYAYWYSVFNTKFLGYSLQARIDSFCAAYSNPVARSMIKLLVEYMKQDKIINIPKIRGHKPQKIKSYLTPEQIALLIKFFDDNGKGYMARLCEICFEGALRIEDMLTLTTDQIDFKNLRIRGTGKGGKDFIVLISQGSADRIAAFVESNHIPGFKRIFNYSYNHVYYQLRIAGKKLDMHVHPHAIRRAAATNLRRKGMTIDQIKEYLRHKNIETTMIYIVSDPKEIESKVRGIIDSSQSNMT